MNLDCNDSLAVLHRRDWSWRSLLRLILQALAVVLPIAFYLRTYDSCMVKITLVQLGTLAALAVWAGGVMLEGRLEIPVRTLPALAPAALLLAWNALRFACAQHRWASCNGFVRQECFLLAIILALAAFSRRELRQSCGAILGSWAVVVLYALLQRLGLDPFIWKGSWGVRVFSTLGNPNFLAAFLLVCAPLSLAWALDEELPLWSRCWIGVGAALASAVVSWTGSSLEGILYLAVLAIFAGLSFFALPRRRRPAAVGLAALCALVALLAARQESRLQGRPDSRDYDISSQAKFLPETWKATLALDLIQPLLGSGPGSFWVRYPAFRKPAVILLEHKHNSETDHPENELLEQWTDGGLVGLGLWLWLFGVLMRRGWRRLRALSGATAYPGEALGLFTTVVAGLLAMLLGAASRFAMPGWLIYFTAGLLGVSCLAECSLEDAVLAVPLPFAKGARLLLLGPILAAALWLGWYGVRSFRSDIQINYAVYWSKDKAWDQALQHYDEMIPASPGYVMGQYFKGNVFQDRNGPGDLDRAVAQYRRVRSLAPDYVLVHYQEGTALRKLGRRQEAIARFEAETALDPVWDAPWHQLSELYGETSQPEKAADAARKEQAAKTQWDQSAKPGAL